ncbi:60S ribosomal protein-like protein L6 [Phyllosticta citrichinensis]|uniref:60S ribosomal protein-like protein L6 n=1 Tax=Phyllosticta citrichinensis TaxID=1130410 RepID=A0ABR1Y7J5_9PEZI
MFSTARRRCLQTASSCVPSRLTPATFQTSRIALSSAAPKAFSTSTPCRSKIGRQPLFLPPEVQFEITQSPKSKRVKISVRDEAGVTIHVKGPLGELSYTVPSFVQVTRETPTSPPCVTVLDANERCQREMWGTVRKYLHNMVLGVSEGHTAILRLVGVGYRASIEDSATTVPTEYPGQKFVNLKVNYSHPVEVAVPLGVKASTPQPTRILLEGPDKVAVMSCAAEIRSWKKPEPYKGKGIFVNDETIKLKSKKIK